MNNKFRGKSIDTKEWIYGGYYEWDNKSYIIQKDIWDRDIQTAQMIEVIPETVGQYTGRKNKDGKEIYDGDICESIDGIFLVTWNEEKSAFIMVFQDGERLYLEEMWEDTKIIGNINDTPELIKVNNED